VLASARKLSFLSFAQESHSLVVPTIVFVSMRHIYGLYSVHVVDVGLSSAVVRADLRTLFSAQEFYNYCTQILESLLETFTSVST
jgi:hypothetical protein